MEVCTLSRLCLILVLLPYMVYTQSCVSPTDQCNCFIQDGKKIINCRYQGLTEIPSFKQTNEVYDEIRFSSAELSGLCAVGPNCNNITRLDDNAFANLTVKVIDLRNNLITDISDFAFVDIANDLEGLLIEGDENINPPYNAIAVLEKLKLLQLDSYGSTGIAQGTAVLPLPNLQTLTLYNWPNLQTLDQNVFSVMRNLTEFKLSKLPSLTNLPVPTIQMFSKLRKLEISDTGISSILGEVFAVLPVLSDVLIRQNHNLANIDNRAFHEVTDTIEFLDLDTNKLSSVSFLLNSDWLKLSHLNIGYNYEINTLPNGIFSTMPKMAYLQCQELGLTSLNDQIFTNLQDLHTLDLAYNQIQNIATGTFQHSPNIVELRLNHQTTSAPITFQDNAFSGIENSLEHLVLSENSLDLSQMWTDISVLSNLKILELDNVGITNIPNKTFAELQNLEAIHLPQNNISEIFQETFFGPKNTLKLIDLRDNDIKTIDSCVLSDFPSKPSLHLNGNKLRCDCDLVWLFDLVENNQASETVFLIGPCTTPDSLANKYFNEFTRNQMCPGGTNIPKCPDLYLTTTTSTSTSTSTTEKPTTTTETPLPNYELRINNEDSTSIELTWIIVDKTYVTGVKLEMKSNYDATKVKYFGAQETSFTFYELRPDNYYTFCLILEINDKYRDDDADCEQARTLSKYTKPPVSTTAVPPESESQIGVIVGGAAGGVVLLALIIAIVVVLLKNNKPKKQKQLSEPVSFTLRADIPHEGGTAKRFAKKGGKEGLEPDDINITMISNGDMSNKDRLSAGSYQTLNEKGVDNRPMPGSSHGHYTNSVEDRPLPRTPHGGSSWTGGATGHGYVNTDLNKNKHLPETSDNQYNEVRY